MSTKGMKDDLYKTRFDLIEPEFTRELAEVMTGGALKYKPYNWTKVKDFETRYTAALHRHLNAYQLGENLDPDSGLSHMAHIAANAMFLFWKEKRNENSDL